MSNNEIESIVDLFRLVWGRRVYFIKVISLFFLLGLTHIITTPNQYESSIVLMPESESAGNSSLGGLGQIAGIAGLNLDMNGASSGISSDLFPEIIDSRKFYLDFMRRPLPINSVGDSISAATFFADYDGRPLVLRLMTGLLNLPQMVTKLFVSNEEASLNTVQPNADLLTMNAKERRVVRKLSERFDVEIKSMNGLIVITAEMPYPYLAAYSAWLAKEYLTDYLTEYKTEKDQKNLDFLISQLSEAKKEYIDAQDRLAALRDSNQNLVSTRVQNQESRLTAELDLAFNVYNNLAQQVAQARISLEKSVPVFRVLEPANVPSGKSSPRAIIILPIMVVLGGLLALAQILFKELILG